MDQKGVLNTKKNPFFEHGAIQLFLAERPARTADRAVGRIAAIVNGQHLAKYDDGNGFFGFFETVEDYDVARALLDAAIGLAQGARHDGRARPDVADDERRLGPARRRLRPAAGDPAALQPAVLRALSRALRLLARDDDVGVLRPLGLHRRRAHGPRGRHRADAQPRHHDPLARHVAASTTTSPRRWRSTTSRGPRTGATCRTRWHEAEHLAKELKPVIEKDIFLFVEDAGTPVAFAASLPNLNRALKKLPNGRLLPTGLAKLLGTIKAGGIYEIRMALMGVLPEYRHRGIEALLIHQTIVNGIRDGYEACEMSWVLDVNKALTNALDKLGGVRDKEYAMLEMSLRAE